MIYDHWTALLLSGILSLLLYHLLKGNPKDYLPGPLALPIIGNVHQILLAGSIIKFCEQNRKKFGNVSNFYDMKYIVRLSLVLVVCWDHNLIFQYSLIGFVIIK